MRDRNGLFIITSISRVVKSIRLPTKIAAYLVSIGQLLWLAFLYILRFSKKNIPGLAAFFDMSALYFKPFWQPCISGKASKHPQYQPVTEVNAVCNPNYFLQVVFQVENWLQKTKQASWLKPTDVYRTESTKSTHWNRFKSTLTLLFTEAMSVARAYKYVWVTKPLFLPVNIKW